MSRVNQQSEQSKKKENREHKNKQVTLELNQTVRTISNCACNRRQPHSHATTHTPTIRNYNLEQRKHKLIQLVFEGRLLQC